MGALSPTKVKATEFSGNQKLKIFTVTPAATSDTVDLSGYFDTIYGVKAHISAGLDAALTLLITSFSGTTVTIVQKKADGTTAADDWTGASIELWVLGSDEGKSL
jgi:ABC-type branched-subunit amino acid transport system substrate-binding protein